MYKSEILMDKSGKLPFTEFFRIILLTGNVKKNNNDLDSAVCAIEFTRVKTTGRRETRRRQKPDRITS